VCDDGTHCREVHVLSSQKIKYGNPEILTSGTTTGGSSSAAAAAAISAAAAAAGL
jgi:hypothetical protein